MLFSRQSHNVIKDALSKPGRYSEVSLRLPIAFHGFVFENIQNRFVSTIGKPSPYWHSVANSAGKVANRTEKCD